jgi:hypothetical protein
MQVVDSSGNVFGQGLEITDKNGKPKVPVINTNITIGTTVIAGGAVGRLLFDDAGVVGETAGLNWNKATSVFTVGATGANGTIQFPTTTSGFVPSIISQFAGNNLIFTVGSRSLSLSGSGQLTTSFNTTITGSTGGTALTVAQGNSGWVTIADFNGSSGTALRINNNGNVLINTTVDAGFKTDINGTLRATGVITGSQFNASNNGGSYSAIGVVLLDYGDGLRIGYSGSVQKITLFTAAGTPRVSVVNNGCVGFTNSSPTANIQTSLSITAASAIARGVYFNNTLVASANNDILVGLDINPTFTNGVFTGVSNFGQRISQSTVAGNNGSQIALRATDGNPGIIGMQGGGWNAIGIWGVGRHTTTSTPDLRIFATGQVIVNTKLFINTTSDAGYAFDCNGTARFTGTIIGPNNSSLNSIIFDGGGTRRIRPEVNSLDITDPSGNIGFRVDSSGVRVASGFSSLDFVRGLNSMVHTTSTIQKMTFTLSGQQVNHLTPFVDIVAAGYAPSAPLGNNTTLRIFTTNTTSGIYGNIIISHNGTSKTGNILIGTSTNVASAIVNVESTTQGLLFPRMSTTEKLAIATPAAGLVIFDTTLNKLCVYTTAWETITSL